jgi:hypothetical protein
MDSVEVSITMCRNNGCLFTVSNKMRIYGNPIENKQVINIPAPAAVPVPKRRLRRYPPIRFR